MSSTNEIRRSDVYPGPFSSNHKFPHRKMLVTFCSNNKNNTINAALDLLTIAGLKPDEKRLNEIYDNKLFYADYYILPFFRSKKGIESCLESLLFTDEVVLFENERKHLNQKFIDACFIFDIPIRFIRKDPVCNAYRFVSDDEIKLEKDTSRINELIEELAFEDYSRYPKMEIDVDYASTAFWINGANLQSNVPYVVIPQLLYRRIYEWADAYWTFSTFNYDDDFVDKYEEESKWIYNELKARLGQNVKLSLSENF